MNLTYRSHARIEDMAEGECTIHRCTDASGARWWVLWFYVRRETDGVLEDFAVPVNPGGSYNEGGAAGRTWGLTQTSPGVWQVSPSINVLDTRRAVAGAVSTSGSLWHQTPAVVGVPAGEAWLP